MNKAGQHVVHSIPSSVRCSLLTMLAAGLFVKCVSAEHKMYEINYPSLRFSNVIMHSTELRYGIR
jgi:hypothetical protein